MKQYTSPEQFLEENTALYFKAINHNRLEEVRAIVQGIEEAEVPSLCGKVVVNQLLQKSGATGLHVSASLGFMEIIKYLVEEKGAKLSQVNLEGKTALHDAAQFSQLEAVKYLLEKGANVNAVKRADWTPLMLACTKQNIEVIKVLLEYGAYPFFTNKDGWNCCHIAAREGNPEIVKIILDSPPPRLRSQLWQTKSRNGRKPVHTAAMHGHLEVVKLLLSQHDPEDTIDYDKFDHCGTSPIMEASRFGFLHLIDYLKEEAQEDLNKCNKQGLNCLHVAAEAGQSEVIRYLVGKYGMDIDLGTEPLKMTPLHWAAKEGQTEAVKTLIELGAQTALLDSKERTPHDVATAFGHPEVAEILSMA